MAIALCIIIKINYCDSQNHGDYCRFASQIVIDFINHILTALIGRIEIYMVRTFDHFKVGTSKICNVQYRTTLYLSHTDTRCANHLIPLR